MRINPIGVNVVSFAQNLNRQRCCGPVCPTSCVDKDSFMRQEEPQFVINVFGAQGSGKGTQAKMLAAYYGVPHISTGDIFRAIKKGQYDYGNIDAQIINNALETMGRGELVDDETTNKILFERLRRPDCKKGYILDGYPRNEEQAMAYDKEFPNTNMIVCNLDVPRDVIVKRITERAVLENRPDDMDETVVAKRLEIYDKKTAPLEEYYRANGRFKNIQVDATVEQDSDPKNVFHNFILAIDEE